MAWKRFQILPFLVLKIFQHAQYAVLKLRDNVKHVKVRMTGTVFIVTYLIYSAYLWGQKHSNHGLPNRASPENQSFPRLIWH